MSAAVAKIHQPPQGPFNSTLVVPDYDGWEEKALREELARRLGLTAENLLHAAAIWVAMERKGYDLSGLKEGVAYYLPRIACGSVLPELVVAFARTPALLRKLTGLTVREQKQLAETGQVEFVVRRGETLSLPVRELTPAQLRQVIGDGFIRDETQQIAYISRPLPEVRPGRPVKRGKIVVTPLTGTISIGRASAPLSDVIKAMKAAGVRLD